MIYDDYDLYDDEYWWGDDDRFDTPVVTTPRECQYCESCGDCFICDPEHFCDECGDCFWRCCDEGDCGEDDW